MFLYYRKHKYFELVKKVNNFSGTFHKSQNTKVLCAKHT